MQVLKTQTTSTPKERRGTALVFAAVIALGIGGLAAALLAINLSTEKVRVSSKDSQRSFYAAEAGLSDAWVQLTNRTLPFPDGQPVFLGTPDAPMTLGPMSYWVEISDVDGGWSLASTGINDGVQERLEIVITRAPTGFFQFAAFGAEGVVLDSNAFIDSYDSDLGPYEDQVQGGNDYARENGNVGSNADILLKSNTEVHGDVTPGPDGILDDSAPGTYVSGSTDPAEELFPMPPIEVPVIPLTGAAFSSSGDVALGPGDVHFSGIQMNGGDTLTLRGPATVVLDRFQMKSGSELYFDTTDGPVEVYGTNDFVLESNSVVTTISNSALDVTLWLSGDNMSAGPRDRVELSANSEFIGAIYAPNVFFRLASNFNVYGSVMCGRLDLSSNGEIHYDEALMFDGRGDSDDFEVALWRELPHQ